LARIWRKRGLLYTVGWNVNCPSHYGKPYRKITQKLKVEQSHDLKTPLLGIHPKESKPGYLRNIFTPMLIAALFTITNI
jgi:hypothetical protein